MSGCKPGVVAAGPRDRNLQNSARAEAVGLEPTSGHDPPPVFKTGSSSGRMTSVFFTTPDAGRDKTGCGQLDCGEILPVAKVLSLSRPSCGGWNRTNDLLGQSQALLPAATTPQSCQPSETHIGQKVRGEGFEPPSPGSKAGSLPLADPRSSRTQECPAGIEPACPAWKAGASADRPRAHVASRRKERESNPQGV